MLLLRIADTFSSEFIDFERTFNANPVGWHDMLSGKGINLFEGLVHGELSDFVAFCAKTFSKRIITRGGFDESVYNDAMIESGAARNDDWMMSLLNFDDFLICVICKSGGIHRRS